MSRGTLHDVKTLRLANVTSVRKTRSRLLRLLILEESSTVDHAYWDRVFRQLTEIRRDFEVEKNMELESRMEAIEMALKDKNGGRQR